ncbi:hypothetical protein LY28_03651 [Ruminiclostridium sufflavum DSM 19573]|uniref:Uncharacterized protein n=1 Tax=Ruminiclostridium sufflavum DSM 19573 TaxID=1121337 RepID=A0A318XFV5_9FIRM|nr:hypothetical protein [Ruminiclostridium sufflavum]PYG84337.1 hypothetical protein LY28_03651 [Ruminiclostridium sufflavum DSM 19573]
MMLYLCSYNNVGLFDWLNESGLVEQPFMLKKISSNQLDLCSFAKKEALSINYYKYLAIDLSAVTNDSDSLRTAIESIRIMNPKIRFIYVDMDNKAEALRDTIRSFGEIPVITEKPEKDISAFKTQTAEALRYTPPEKEAGKEQLEDKIPKPNNKNTKAGSEKSSREYIIESKNIMIAVLNTYPKAGATTLSINMAEYLREIGAAAAYVECSGELEHLKAIAGSVSGFTKTGDNSFERNGIIYLKNEIPEGMNFIINDLSRIIQDGTEKNALEFTANCQKIILCGTSKPYELEETENKIRILEENGCKEICLCLAFTPDSEKASLTDKFGSRRVKVYFTEYTPDMFKSKNKEIYKRILQEYILEKTDDKLVRLF